MLKLTNGGYVERNAALMQDDVLYVISEAKPALMTQNRAKFLRKNVPNTLIVNDHKLGAYDA